MFYNGSVHWNRFVFIDHLCHFRIEVVLPDMLGSRMLQRTSLGHEKVFFVVSALRKPWAILWLPSHSGNSSNRKDPEGL